MERRKPRKDARPVTLPAKERAHLERLTRQGKTSARILVRARILLLLDDGWAPIDIPEATGCGIATVGRVRTRYGQQGLDRALVEAPRRGKPRLLTEKQGARIVAMVCGDPPMGHARWTLEVIAEQSVKRKIVKAVGRETVRILLRDHDLKPWREKNVVRGRARR